MKKLLLIVIFLGSTITQAQLAWTQLNNFPIEGSERGKSFKINGEVYVPVWSLGESPSLYSYKESNDTWELVTTIFDNEEVASLIYAFTLNDIPYFIGNTDSDSFQLWQYFIETDTWVEKTGYSGLRKNAFSINDYGFVLISDTPDNFIKYDPVSDQWELDTPYPGNNDFGHTDFVIDDKGYILFDRNEEGSFSGILWQYDSETATWAEKASYPDGYVYDATSLVVEGLAYVGMGIDMYEMFSTSFHRYVPSTDNWQRINRVDYGGLSEGDDGAIGVFSFELNGFGYIGGGNSEEIFPDENESPEFYEYDMVFRLNPEFVLNIDDIEEDEWSIFPNPVTDQLFIQSERPIQEVTIYNLVGQTVLQTTPENNQLDVSSLSQGVYLVELNNEDGKLVRKLVKE